MRTNRIGLKRWALFYFLILILFSAHAKSEGVNDEYAKKSWIIRKIITIATWPDAIAPKSDLKVCVLGKPTYDKVLEDLNGAIINSHKIVLKKIPVFSPEIQECQFVYLFESEKASQKKVIDFFASKPAFIISDTEGFARSGGSMNFINLNGILAVTLNLESIKNAHLSIDLKAFSQVTILPEKKDILQ